MGFTFIHIAHPLTKNSVLGGSVQPYFEKRAADFRVNFYSLVWTEEELWILSFHL